jgi:hypothetical protein
MSIQAGHILRWVVLKLRNVIDLLFDEFGQLVNLVVNGLNALQGLFGFEDL